MADEFTLKLNSPLTEEEWDLITDVDLNNTPSVMFHTKHGKDVEYVKLKHGRWIWNKRLGNWYCSNCDRIMNPYTIEKSEGLYEMTQPPYCGWCGADMRGVNE